jgi:hypothetical protein
MTTNTSATTSGVPMTNLILRDIPLSINNTITVNGTQFFQQPIYIENRNGFVMDDVQAPPQPPETELQRLIRTDPKNYGKHRQPPDPKKNWREWNQRRMKGEHGLLKMMDVCDRLQWFESKSVCLQYPVRKPSRKDYDGRILLLHPEGKYEFSSTGKLMNRRNIWINYHEDKWSWEDMIITMVFQFQLNPDYFVYHVGCRDSLYPDDDNYKQVRKDFEYGYKLRLRAKERDKFQNLCNPFMENRRLPTGDAWKR